MSENNLLSYEIYKLENDRSLILFPEFLVVVPKTSSVEEIANGISNGSIDTATLEKNVQANKKGVFLIKLSSVEDIYSNLKHDTNVLIYYIGLEASTVSSKKISFKTMDEKNRFMDKLSNYVREDFTSEIVKNTIIQSVSIPLKKWISVLFYFACLLVIVFIVESQESTRIPVVIYPIILLIEHIGIMPILALIAIISLIYIVWIIKSIVNPSERLAIKRKN